VSFKLPEQIGLSEHWKNVICSKDRRITRMVIDRS